jgi:cell division protein FtsZ
MAISSPLLEASIDGAHGVLLSIQGGSDLGLFEINEAAQLVSNSAAPDANIIFGAVIDDALGDEVRVTVIAAGFDESQVGRAGRVRSASATSSFGGPSGPLGEFTASSGWRSSAPSAGDVPPATRAETSAAEVRPAAEHPAAEISPRADSEQRAAPALAGPASAAEPAAEGTAPENGGAAVVDGVPPPRAAEAPAAAGPDTVESSLAAARASAGWVPDSASTRRRSVVFEEDDDLDVPDFLK